MAKKKSKKKSKEKQDPGKKKLLKLKLENKKLKKKLRKKKEKEKEARRKEEKKKKRQKKPAASLSVESRPAITGPADHSSNYKGPEAIKKLRALKTREELLAFTKGEKRITVSKVIPAALRRVK